MSDIIRISELTPAPAPPFAATTLFEISVDGGGGSWLTRRAPMADITATIGAGLGLTPKATASSPVSSTVDSASTYPASAAGASATRPWADPATTCSTPMSRRPKTRPVSSSKGP
jgi:hypothetical protein